MGRETVARVRVGRKRGDHSDGKPERRRGVQTRKILAFSDFSHWIEMPIYEYACRACGNRFEQRLRYDERLKQQPCPKCGGTQASLCMSAPALVGGGAQAAPTCQSTGGACGCGRFS